MCGSLLGIHGGRGSARICFCGCRRGAVLLGQVMDEIGSNWWFGLGESARNDESAGSPSESALHGVPGGDPVNV